MSTSTDPDGDVPIDITARLFSHPDAAFLSGVPGKSISNWMYRHVLRIGRKHPVLGRWEFSVCDLIRLVVMRGLCLAQNMAPKDAAAVAEIVVQIAMEGTARDGAGKLLAASAQYAPNRNVLITFGPDDRPILSIADIQSPAYYPPRGGDPATAPLRRPHIIVPATAIVHDLILRTQELARHNARAEAPVHV